MKYGPQLAEFLRADRNRFIGLSDIEMAFVIEAVREYEPEALGELPPLPEEVLRDELITELRSQGFNRAAMQVQFFFERREPQEEPE